LHKFLYGASSQGNELTKSLIVLAHNAKKCDSTVFAKEGEEWVKKMKDENNLLPTASFQKILIQYCQSAYCCLSIVLIKTQTKEIVFPQFLFITNRDKNESLWENIVPNETYDFKVETNFSYSGTDDHSFNKKQSTSIANQYISESLFIDANLKDGTIIFDTQANQMTSSEYLNMFKIQPIQGEALEIDSINSNCCMLRMIQVITHLHKLFGATWKEMPQWMQALLAEIKRDNIPLSMRLFFIKAVINL